MSVTQYEAFREFVEKNLSVANLYTSIYSGKDHAQMIDEATSVIEPFLLNPERHRRHLRLIVRGFAIAFVARFVEDVGPVISILKFLDKWLTYPARRSYQNYIDELRQAQDELYATIEAGEIQIDLLPAKSLKAAEGEAYGDVRLIGLQVNVAVRPTQGVDAQSLSIKIEVDDDKLQFSDTVPSTHFENVGSSEVGISGSGKFVRAEKESDKLTAKMGATAAGLNLETSGELAGERSHSLEISRSGEVKVTRQDVAPAVISAAVGNTAQWDFLRTPTQPLLGGFKVIATAFVPKELVSAPIKVSALVQFQGWGPQQRVINKEISLPQEEPESNPDEGASSLRPS